ncbi:hypothetical protein B0T09DRAFT_334173 [Sordaria sp. MPI-SDFR-AT-0083]|nr:hypothetical protein B0T09DRAFT_334173 [Sordaria sp. MPI-SDFR-AT-0083]
MPSSMIAMSPTHINQAKVASAILTFSFLQSAIACRTFFYALIPKFPCGVTMLLGIVANPPKPKMTPLKKDSSRYVPHTHRWISMRTSTFKGYLTLSEASFQTNSYGRALGDSLRLVLTIHMARVAQSIYILISVPMHCN